MFIQALPPSKYMPEEFWTLFEHLTYNIMLLYTWYAEAASMNVEEKL
jgi:hypothetical protein